MLAIVLALTTNRLLHDSALVTDQADVIGYPAQVKTMDVQHCVEVSYTPQRARALGE